MPSIISYLYFVGTSVEADLPNVNVLAQTNKLQEAVLPWEAWDGEDAITAEEDGCAKQKSWDTEGARVILEGPILEVPDPKTTARLLAASYHESGLWQDARPVASLGT